MVTYATILAGGSGLRFLDSDVASSDSNTPKQFAKVGGKTLLELSVQKFENTPAINYIILVVNSQYIDRATKIVNAARFKKVVKIVPGGDSRHQSSYRGLLACKDHKNANGVDVSNCSVLIHDAVRPFVEVDIISKIISELNSSANRTIGVQPIVPLTQTITQNVSGNWITQNRSDYAIVQTPQGFRLDAILSAYQELINASNSDFDPTDDISVLQMYDKSAKISTVNGDRKNIKITFKEDLNVRSFG